MTESRGRPGEPAPGGHQDGPGSRRRAAAAGAVAGFGAAFVGQQLVVGWGSLLSRGLLELPFLLLALGLVYGGVWLLGSGLDARRVRRIAGWSAGGLVGLVAVAVWLLPGGGGPTAGLLQVTADVGTVGAAAGLLAGLEAERRPARPAAVPAVDGDDPRFEHFNRQLRHHLLNGAAVIKGHAELLLETERNDPEAAAVIRSRADELVDLVRNAATLGMAATGELPRVPIELGPVLAASRTSVAGERPDASITVASEELPPVWGNEELETAVTALLRAAVDASAGGHVHVTVEPVGGVLELRLAYDGPPLPGLGAASPEELSLHLAETLVEAAGGRVVSDPGTGILVRLEVA